MFRSKLAILVLLFSLFATLTTFAQRGSRAQSNQVEIQVHVTYPDERPAPKQLRVDLMDASGITAMEAFTDDSGQVHFYITGSGSFRVKVSGIGIEETVSDGVQINPDDRFKPVYVQVHPTSDADSGSQSKPGNRAMTSASDLKIPSTARKWLEKGLQAFQQKDYKKAADLFQKAIVIYPEYDAAYDNLGVALMNLGRTAEARTAFQHAVQLNDKNPDADRNYSRLLISDEQYVAAKDLLQKALTVEPQAPSSLVLLAIAQLRTGDYDGALHSALTVHQVSHEGYAVAHYIAGRAFENKQELQNATTEYKMYLRESPNGPEASQVRAGLARVSANAQAAPE
jgi:Flp pilus assembly protein TadD